MAVLVAEKAGGRATVLSNEYIQMMKISMCHMETEKSDLKNGIYEIHEAETE